MTYTLYKHQQETLDFLKRKPRAYLAHEMGCGKTACIVKDVEAKLAKDRTKKALILAPKSLLHTVWEADFKKFAPNIIVSVGTAPTSAREQAFITPAHVYITNIDALTWLAKKPASFWKHFDYIAIDESTAIKNTSSRGKAAQSIRKHFTYRRCMSGTPHSGNLTDLFQQYLFLDDGAHFGLSKTKFQMQVQYSVQTGPSAQMRKWYNKEGQEELLAYMVKDITIRYALEDVVDMPSRVSYSHTYQLSSKVRRVYEDLKRDALVQLKTGTISAVNAASLTTKLLQTAAGAIYDENGDAHLVDTQRYDLVLDLVEQTPYSVVFYNWTSQREYLIKQANKRKIKACFIDGSVPGKRRGELVTEFQNGEYQTIFLQVQAASHGITLTKATTTIWASPTYLADYYIQANARIFRIGQDKRTVTINVEADDTLENKVYEALTNKLNSIDMLNEALK